MFDPKSRYAKIPPVHVTDARGRTVEAVPPAPHPKQTLRGIHLRKQNERADHLALLYLGDATAYWRLAEQNDAMTAEVLSELREVEIPDPLIADEGT
jgi:hypothetical protein